MRMEDNGFVIMEGGLMDVVGNVTSFSGVEGVDFSVLVRDKSGFYRLFFCRFHDVQRIDVMRDRVELCWSAVVRHRLEVRAGDANEEGRWVLFDRSRDEDMIDCGSAGAKGSRAVVLWWWCFGVLYRFGRIYGVG